MRKLIAVLLLLVPFTLFAQMDATVMPQPDGSMFVLLPAETVKFCAENGGCRLVTTADLEAALKTARATCSNL